MVACLETAAAVLAVAYGALAFYAWEYSDGLIFLPPPPTYPAGPDILNIPAPDGPTIAARWLPYPESHYTIVYFHGNAKDLGDIEPRMQSLRDRLQVSVLAWDFPGYGRSGGAVGEPATLHAARAVVAYAKDALGVPPERIILYGRSLGGGPAVDVAALFCRAPSPARFA